MTTWQPVTTDKLSKLGETSISTNQTNFWHTARFGIPQTISYFWLSLAQLRLRLFGVLFVCVHDKLLWIILSAFLHHYIYYIRPFYNLLNLCHTQTNIHTHTKTLTHTHKNAHTHIHTQTHTNIFSHTHTHTYSHTLYTHTYIHAHTHIYTITHTHTYAHKHTIHAHTHIHNHTHSHMHTHIHTHTQTLKKTRTHTYTHKHTHIHTHTHTYTLTHKHTQSHTHTHPLEFFRRLKKMFLFDLHKNGAYRWLIFWSSAIYVYNLRYLWV